MAGELRGMGSLEELEAAAESRLGNQGEGRAQLAGHRQGGSRKVTALRKRVATHEQQRMGPRRDGFAGGDGAMDRQKIDLLGMARRTESLRGRRPGQRRG